MNKFPVAAALWMALAGRPAIAGGPAFMQLEDLAGAPPAPVPAVAAARPPAAPRWAIGVQTRIEPSVYEGEAAFQARLEAALDGALADPRVGPSDAALIVLPEYFGAWLAVSEEPPAVYRAPDRTRAMLSLLWADGAFRSYLFAQALRRGKNPLDGGFLFASLIRFRAARLWSIYKEAAVRALARERAWGHEVTLVAGSIVLPPLDRLSDPDAPLYNTSFIFGPGGELLGVSRKAYPVQGELAFTARAPVSDLKPVMTPAGLLGDMICADGWFPDVYARLAGSRILTQPSYGESDLAGFSKPWGGYSGAPAPADADPADVGALTGRQAWRKYSLATRIRLTGARYGLNPFLSGRMWDKPAGGYGIGVDLGRSGADVEEVATNPARDTFIYLKLADEPAAAP